MFVKNAAPDFRIRISLDEALASESDIHDSSKISELEDNGGDTGSYEYKCKIRLMVRASETQANAPKPN